MNAAQSHLRGKRIICDLGCGREGDFLTKINGVIQKGIGFDRDVRPTNNPKIRLLSADLNKPLPLPDATVGIVTSLAVIEHLDEYERHVQEAYRILIPRGRFILTTPAPQTKPLWNLLIKIKLIGVNEIDDHKRYFNKPLLVNLFKRAGFKKIKYRRFQFGFNQLVVGQK